MFNEYEIQLRRESTYSVLVFRYEDKYAEVKKKKLEWILDLEGDDEPIVFCELYDASKFLVMNWNGWLRAYDIETKAKIFDHDYDCHINCRALMDRSLNKLYVAVEPEGEEPQMIILDLPSLEEMESYELPREVNVRQMFVQGRKNKKFIFYDTYENHSMTTLRSARYGHGFHVFDSETETTTFHSLPSPPRSSVSRPSPMVNTDMGYGIIKDWEDVEVKLDENGNRVFIQKLIAFDMNNLEPLYHFPVREFYEHQLASDEEESLEIADILEKRDNMGKNADQYDEALTRFNETLCDVHLESEQEYIWITWEGGLVRKMFINGKYKSPILVPKELENGKIPGTFGFDFNHTTLINANFEQVILQVGGDKKLIDVKNIELVNESIDWLAVEHTPFTDEMDGADKAVIERVIKEQEFIIIDDPNASTKERAFYNGLEMIIDITANLDKYRRGNTLKFLFRFADGVEMTEDEFFLAATKVDYTDEMIETIIENFTTYDEATYLYRDDESLALSSAIHYFSCRFESCFESALRYLAIVDFQHEVYCCEQFIPELMAVYKNTIHYPKLLLMTETLDDSDFSRAYLYQEFLNENSAFRQWYNDGGKEKIPELFKELSRYGFGLNRATGPSSAGQLDSLKELMDVMYHSK